MVSETLILVLTLSNFHTKTSFFRHLFWLEINASLISATRVNALHLLSIIITDTPLYKIPVQAS